VESDQLSQVEWFTAGHGCADHCSHLENSSVAYRQPVERVQQILCMCAPRQVLPFFGNVVLEAL